MTDRELRNYKRKLRRQRELRRNFFVVILTVCIVLTCAISYNALVSKASDDMSDVSYKYFTSIEVESGETLWSIAEEYKDNEFYASTKEYVDEVMNMNHLSSEKLVAGQCLIIPYYSKEFVK